MKCYAIKSGEEYVADVPMPVSLMHWSIGISTVEHNDEAKHYKNKSIPNAWVKKNIGKFNEIIVSTQSYIKQETAKNPTTYNNKYYIQSYKERLEKLKRSKSWLENAQVIELDLETPNFPSAYKVSWDYWRKDNHMSRMFLSTNTTNKYSCKACGLKLKNVPYYDIPEGNGSRVCVPCLYLRLDAIKTAYESMPEDYRTTITNELILGGL